MHQLQYSIVELTPEKARAILNKNKRNRRIAPGHVMRVAAAIQRNEWRLNGDAIKIDTDGNLVDGQHRCLAVIEADQPITTILIEGVEPDAQSTMDLGRPRTLRDLLRMDEVKDYSLVAAIVNMVMKVEDRWQAQDRGQLGTTKRHTNTVTLLHDVYNANAERYGDAALSARRMYVGVRWPLSSLGAVAYFAATPHPEEWENFVVSVETGENLLHGDPALALRTAALNRTSHHGKMVDSIYAFAVATKAWNCFYENRTIVKIPFALNGSRREQLPRVL